MKEKSQKIKCIENSIKCRTEVLDDFKRFNVDENKRPLLEKGLQHFKNLLKKALDEG